MKKSLLILGLVIIGSTASANDGGISAIKVDQIKMRETAWKNNDEVLVRKIAKPQFKITFEGGEAAKLQKILPSIHSVFTSMHPELTKLHDESFKSLGIFSGNSKGTTGKAIRISCNDAEFSNDGEKIYKTGKSVCEISIEGMDAEFGPGESPEGMDGQFEPKSCK